MGQVISTLTGFAETPPSVVLVPPLLERERKGRSRFAKSSYDRQFAQPQLRQLFGDYLGPDVRGTLHFSPREDERVSLTAKLGAVAPALGRPAGADARAGAAPGAEPVLSLGTVCLRFEPDPSAPYSFVDLKARLAPHGATAALRGCAVRADSGFAVFGSLPLGGGDAAAPALRASEARCGVRYTTPALSLGAILTPASGELHQAWAVGRVGPLMWGVQTSPHLALGALGRAPPAPGKPGSPLGRDPSSPLPQPLSSRLSAALAAASDTACYAVAYQPAGQSAYGRGMFTAVAELREERSLRVSFLHHMALQRNVRNPFEARDVVGITNYVNVGLQMEADLTPGPAAAAAEAAARRPTSAMAIAASWQVNKNVMLKARVGLHDVSVAGVVRSWWQPSFTGALAASYDFDARTARVGLTATVESFRHLRYERSGAAQKVSGARLTQRHVASDEDLAYHAGQGLLVPLSDVDDPAVMGQVPPPGADCL